jgi:hypothetical protein
MAQLPYVVSPGNIDKALNGIKSAAVPERVSQDFVKTILKISGSSGDQMTSFLKKLGLTNSDGTPNETYRKFRNPSSSGPAIASSIKTAYAPLYIRNEFMHELNDNDLLGLVVEETGLPHDSNPVRLIVSCIKHLKSFANFSGEPQKEASSAKEENMTTLPAATPQGNPGSAEGKRLGLNLGYTINLNLPATSDPEVFDAIFSALKNHLLRDADG